MAKARCILCGTELVGKTCPKCSVGAAGDPMPIDRDTDRARPAAKRRGPPPMPMPVAFAAADAEGETDKVAALQTPARRAKPPKPESEAEAEPASEGGPGEEAEAPKSTAEAKKNWYALAGMEPPADLPSAHGQDDELLPPVSTKEDELRGYHPAALIFAATGLASFAIAATGRAPDVAAGVMNLTAAGALMKHYGWARFLAIAFSALHIAKMGVGLALTGSGVFVIAMLPQACVIAAFVLEDAKWRGVAAGIGVALAFSWVAAYAFRPAVPEKTDALADFVVAGGKFVDDKLGVAVQAPKGIELLDAAKAMEAAQEEKGGLAGLFIKSVVKSRPTSNRLLVRGADVDLAGVVRIVTLPPKVLTSTVMPQIFGEGSKPIRDDELVPRAIRETDGIKSEGWREYSLRAVLLRANDGRLLTVTCDSKAAVADHLCQQLFLGTSLKPTLK